MAVLAPGGVQLGLQIGGRAGLCSCRRPPPNGVRSKELLPVIEQVGAQSQFVGNNCGGLAALQPILDGFAFKCFVEFTARFDRRFFHGLDGSLFAQFPVRQFEATSEPTSDSPKPTSDSLRVLRMCLVWNIGLTKLTLR